MIERVDRILEKHGLMRDENFVAQEPIKRILAKYENPRKLPEKWLVAYLERKPELLALDVMRAFDENAELKREALRFRHAVVMLVLYALLDYAHPIYAWIAKFF
jgi:hypothetical protein